MCNLSASVQMIQRTVPERANAGMKDEATTAGTCIKLSPPFWNPSAETLTYQMQLTWRLQTCQITARVDKAIQT